MWDAAHVWGCRWWLWLCRPPAAAASSGLVWDCRDQQYAPCNPGKLAPAQRASIGPGSWATMDRDSWDSWMVWGWTGDSWMVRGTAGWSGGSWMVREQLDGPGQLDGLGTAGWSGDRWMVWGQLDGPGTARWSGKQLDGPGTAGWSRNSWMVRVQPTSYCGPQVSWDHDNTTAWSLRPLLIWSPSSAPGTNDHRRCRH